MMPLISGMEMSFCSVAYLAKLLYTCWVFRDSWCWAQKSAMVRRATRRVESCPKRQLLSSLMRSLARGEGMNWKAYWLGL